MPLFPPCPDDTAVVVPAIVPVVILVVVPVVVFVAVAIKGSPVTPPEMEEEEAPPLEENVKTKPSGSEL